MKRLARAIILGTGGVAVVAHAASVTIADTPMAVRNTAKSNIMFTVDDSGGTDVDVLLTTYNSMYYETGVTPTNNPSNLNGNFYLFPSWQRENNGVSVSQESLMLEGDLNSPDANHWRARNSNYNAQYYNPFKVYQPWPGTDANGNTFAAADPTRAFLSTPYFWTNASALDLTQAFSSNTATTASVYQWSSGAWASQSWTPPQAHTFLGTTGTDLTSTGGRYYNSTWYPATYYYWSDAPQYVSTITLTSGGSGYPASFTFSITGGNGSGATATATSTSGVVTAVTLTAPGSGYTTPFTITIPGGGNNATASITVGGNGIMDAGEGVRYEIKNPAVAGGCTPTASGAKIPGCSGHPATYPNGNTYAQEIQNFANWFQYYRTPLLALQGALGKQVETLGGVNVGLINLQSKIDSGYSTWRISGDKFFGYVQDMAVANNVRRLRNNLYAIQPNLGDWHQPLHERLSLIYDYFRQSSAQNNHAAPIQYACQQNFHVLSTPGYLNESAPFTNSLTGVTPAGIPTANYDSTKGVPYADSYSDTLADWAAYFYDQNLRPDLTAGQVPTTASAHDDNSNLHITQYVVAPGAQPTLQSAGRLNGTALEKLNPMTTDPWAITPSISWPQPALASQTTVDDLWHAAVNGRGKFVNDTDIYGGLKTVLNDIFGRVGASAAVAVSNANISPGDNFSYASSYNSGNWSGDLQSYPIDLVSGLASTTPRWVPSAQGQLDLLVQNTTRTIATYNGVSGLPFQWASLDAAHRALLNSPMTPPGTADGASVLAFLRGERKNEGTVYRTRGHILGDIVNAEPMILREPQFAYADAGYAAYKVTFTPYKVGAVTVVPRTSVVFQAANDGMLHAFNAGTGAELWAYVPGLLFNSRLGAYPSTSTLANLSFRSGFTHQYMVDGTPTVGDVDFGNTQGATTTTPDWRAILVGGLNKGGRGYYALDVTVPDKASLASTTALTETQLAGKVLWEFPNNSTANSDVLNIGYSYAKPYITKTKAAGWVALVTSGYNNGTNAGDSGGDGNGHLYVLNAKTGALIKDIPTFIGSPGVAAGSTATPSGLGQIVGYSDNAYQDNTVKFVYGGDLKGNVWRFDLSGSTVTSWKVDLLAQLTDVAGAAQPITTMPSLALLNGKPMVFVGTGQYLGDADIGSTQTQSMYGLIDTYDPATPNVPATITSVRTQLNQQQLTAANTTTRTISLKTAAATTPVRGWFVDFDLTAGERIITDPAIAVKTLVFTTNIPSSANPCKPGGSSWMYSIDFAGGNSIPGSSAGSYLGETLASRPILVRLPNGNIFALVRKSDATTTTQSVPTWAGAGVPRRVSWREVRQQ